MHAPPRRARDPRRRGRGARLSQPRSAARRVGYAGTFGRAGAYSASMPPRRSRPARAGCSSRTTTRWRTRARIDAPPRHQPATPGSATRPSGSWYYEIEEAGFKYNLTDIAAALGLVQLERADELLQTRRGACRGVPRAARRRRIGGPARAARGRPWTDRMPGTCTSSGCTSTASRSIAPRSSSASRRPASGRASTSSRSTSTRTTGSAGATRAIPLPIASREYERVVSLPLWPGMTPDDIRRVTGSLDDVLAGSPRLAGSAQDGGDGPGQDLKIEERRPAVEVLGVQAKLRGQDLRVDSADRHPRPRAGARYRMGSWRRRWAPSARAATSSTI